MACWCATSTGDNPLVARFVSYAQNYEDVILWRALKYIENGFYVDCGAYDPDRDSVTRAFYERGWHGINIEPIATLLQKFVAQRPRDINLSLALSDNSNGAQFFEIADTGLSTLLPDVAHRHINAGFVIRQTEVPTRRLSDVLGQYAKDPIHFLKIDVEGAEDLVIRGADLGKFRPWVILVEATKPRSCELSAGWEGRLIACGYDFAYFDGLNRFYVAKEHSELSAVLAVPPNVFDDFVKNDQLEAVAVAQRAVEAITRSMSWRLTAPLRNAKLALRVVREDPGQLVVLAARLLRRLRKPDLRLHQIRQLYESAVKRDPADAAGQNLSEYLCSAAAERSPRR